MKKKLNFIITPDGQVQLEVKGLKGKKCMEIAQSFAQAIDGQITKNQTTSEFFEPQEVTLSHEIFPKQF